MTVGPRVTVVGSFIMDLVIKAPRRPSKGETIVGTSFGMFPGGKGANQAVAAARLGADVAMIGRLGQDEFGDTFLRLLSDEGVDCSFVVRDPDEGTGIGNPVIDGEGDNSIIIVPRANSRLSTVDVDRAIRRISTSHVLLLQLEVPIESSVRAAETARSSGVKVILNPAPAGELPDSFVQLIDVLVPNETEFEMLTGTRPTDIEQARRGAFGLISKGIGAVVITLGERGAFLIEKGRTTHLPGERVDNVVDTTGAGDAFCGALAVCVGRGMSLRESVKVANKAGAHAVTVLGAIPSMPRAADIALNTLAC